MIRSSAAGLSQRAQRQRRYRSVHQSIRRLKTLARPCHARGQRRGDSATVPAMRCTRAAGRQLASTSVLTASAAMIVTSPALRPPRG